jgi:hypothetical protein
VNFKGSHRVVLSVSLLQRSVALEVDLDWIVSIEKKSRAAASALLTGVPERVVS